MCLIRNLAACPPPTQALKDREEAVRNGKLTTIVFIRDKNSKGQVGRQGQQAGGVCSRMR